MEICGIVCSSFLPHLYDFFTLFAIVSYLTRTTKRNTKIKKRIQGVKIMKNTIGQKIETWINQETGEVREVQEIDVKATDVGFEKIWVGMILAVLDIVGGRKKDIVAYLVSNRVRSENIVFATQRKISEEVNVSLKTVTETIQALKKQNIVTQVTPGCYRINPGVIWRGSHLSRMAIMAKFSEEKAASGQKDEKPQQEPQKAKKAASGQKEADLEQGTLPGVSLPQPEICEEIDPDSGEQCGGRLVPETRDDGIWHVCERCGTGSKIRGSGCEYSQPSTPAA